ncbi:MAG: hypothetical protein DMF87_07200 [Acidobacteria bacterium]|nr:MAG: hypothetical protein DMF87_07200 [Acidobacteriota bacterium]
MRSRREFLQRGLTLAGAAGAALAGLPSTTASAQAPAGSVRRSDRYDDSFIFERKAFRWPGNATLAIWIAPNVEVWRYDSPGGQAISPNERSVVPDVVNYAWREYGMRVGLWRLADVLDAAGVRATVALNSAVIEAHPKAVDEMKRRRWEFMGHGITNTENLAGLPLEKERALIQAALKTIEQATGSRPRGWLGPGLTETYNTLDLLAEEGVIYCGDWNSDDQPYPMKVRMGVMFSIPYCMEINDIPLFIRTAAPDDHGTAAAEPLPRQGARAHEKPRARLVCDGQRDHRRVPARDSRAVDVRAGRSPARTRCCRCR